MAVTYERMPPAQRGGGQRGEVKKMGGSASLAELLNVILDKGIVIDAWIRLSVIGIEILTLEARVVVASVSTYLRYAEAIGLTELASPPRGQQEGQQGRETQQNGHRELSGDEILDYLEDHPEGLRVGEMQAYFDAPRDEVQNVLNRLTDEHKVRQDEQHKLYFPENENNQ